MCVLSYVKLTLKSEPVITGATVQVVPSVESMTRGTQVPRQQGRNKDRGESRKRRFLLLCISTAQTITLTASQATIA